MEVALRLDALRQYWSDVGAAAAQDNTFTISVSDIKSEQLFDLHCKVLEVRDVGGATVLFVWDGSDAQPFPPQDNTDSGGATGGGATGGGVTGVEAMGVGAVGVGSTGNGSSTAPTSCVHFPQLGRQCWMPLQQDEPAKEWTPWFGTAFPVVIFDRAATENLPAAGRWIRLRELSCWVRDGQLQGLFVDRSKWAHVEPNRVWLDAAAERLETRQVAMWAPANQQGGMTRILHDHQPLHTLREVLMAAAPSRHHCLVRVVQHFPKDVHDFCSERPEGPKGATIAGGGGGGADRAQGGNRDGVGDGGGDAGRDGGREWDARKSEYQGDKVKAYKPLP